MIQSILVEVEATGLVAMTSLLVLRSRGPRQQGVKMKKIKKQQPTQRKLRPETQIPKPLK